MYGYGYGYGLRRRSLLLSGAALLLAGETAGVAFNFTVPDLTKAVLVKGHTSGNGFFAVESFFANLGASPKQLDEGTGIVAWLPHNLFVNPSIPATQSIVNLIVGATYTYGVVGAGSLAGSSGASGTATAGSPVTFVATATTGVFTVSGSLTRMQINRGFVLTAFLDGGASVRMGIALDFHPVTGAALGVLSEAAMTNVAKWSRDLTNAVWTKTDCTAIKDQVGADGIANSATRLTATAANATCLQAITLSSSQRKQSAYLRRITGVGAVQMTTDNGSTWTTVTPAIGSYGLGRIPAQTLANPTIGFRIVASGDEVAIDFVQNETGECVTSPFPAFSAAATRAADEIFVLTSAFPFAAAFTVILTAAPCSATATFLGFSDGTNNERHQIDTQSGSRLARLIAIDGGATQANFGVVATPIPGQFYNIGIGVEADNFAVVVDGSSPATDMSGTVPTVTKMFIGGAQGDTGGNVHIRTIVVLPRRMTNAEIQAATTPQTVLFDKTKVVVQQQSGTILVYTPGDNLETSKYIRHQFLQFSGALGGGSGWSWERIHEATRTATDVFALGSNLTDVGAHWPAIREAGKDFVGGDVHGYEVDSDFTLKTDGVTRTINGSTSYVATTAELIRNSTFYDINDGTTPIMSMALSMTFSATEIVLGITLTALKNLSMQTIYSHMLSFSLYLNYPSESEINIDEIYASPDFIEGAVGTEVSPLQADRLLMIGSTSDISADVQMTAGWADAARGSFIQVASVSRKMYFAPRGINRSPALALLTNDVISATASIRITTHN